MHVLGTVDRYEYYWCDGVSYKKPTKLPAAKYIELLMEWVEVQINNEELFPQTVGEQRDDVLYYMFLSCLNLFFCSREHLFVYSEDSSDMFVIPKLFLLLRTIILCQSDTNMRWRFEFIEMYVYHNFAAEGK